MLRKLLAASIIFIIAYAVGAISGYRAAVADYVENDAHTIRSMADSMYDDLDPQTPAGVKRIVEETKESDSQKSAEGRGFQ